jgi:hypothetical protein
VMSSRPRKCRWPRTGSAAAPGTSTGICDPRRRRTAVHVHKAGRQQGRHPQAELASARWIGAHSEVSALRQNRYPQSGSVSTSRSASAGESVPTDKAGHHKWIGLAPTRGSGIDSRNQRTQTAPISTNRSRPQRTDTYSRSPYPRRSRYPQAAHSPRMGRRPQAESVTTGRLAPTAGVDIHRWGRYPQVVLGGAVGDLCVAPHRQAGFRGPEADLGQVWPGTSRRRTGLLQDFQVGDLGACCLGVGYCHD